MENWLPALYSVSVVIVVSYLFKWRSDPLRSVPTVGGSDLPFFSYLSSFQFSENSRQLLEEGYRKHYGSVFKVPLQDKWMVVVSGPKLVDDLRRRPDEELSFRVAAAETIQTKHTVGPGPTEDPYHVDIIREKLTRALPAVLPDVIDELQLAVGDHIPAKEDEWLPVDVMGTIQKIVARASSRVFVGEPACRIQEYLDLSVTFTVDVIKDKTVLNLLPDLFKPVVAKLFANRALTNIRRARKHLKPMIDERIANVKKYGSSWTEKPNDMLQWIIETAETRDNTYEAIIQRVMLVNFAAIHTSSNSFTHVLYHLAQHPQYLAPLREEIEAVIKEEGWTKLGMGKMWKLDSFFRESQRINGISLVSLTRIAMKDVTLADGTLIPRGTLVSAASYPTHHDESLYADPELFDPFRFARMREEEGGATRHQFVNTSVDYMPFGHGKHACPGRFFAANELKAMLAYIVLHYDLKLPDGTEPPVNSYDALSVMPAPKGKVMFRKRQASV
ncbi:cytochrome P450 [Trametes meyenii]|nr:cytochrome P450 [Trametes meyenii]